MGKHRGAALAFGAAVAAWSGEVAAEDHVPQAIKDALELECLPQCTLCHRDNNGGTGTATKPFVGSVGILVLSDTAGALETARQNMTDADGDMVTDIDELIANTDPNSRENGPICSEVKYGCGARIAPQTPVHSGSTLALALAGVVLMRRHCARAKIAG